MNITFACKASLTKYCTYCYIVYQLLYILFFREKERYCTLYTCKQHTKLNGTKHFWSVTCTQFKTVIFWNVAICSPIDVCQSVYHSPRFRSWRQCVALKYSYPTTRLCCDISHKTKVIIFTAVRTVISHAFNFFLSEILICFCCSQYI